MQLSYRGCHYTPATNDFKTVEQVFKGQFLGLSKTCTVFCSDSAPSTTVSLTYRGQHYPGDR